MGTLTAAADRGDAQATNVRQWWAVGAALSAIVAAYVVADLGHAYDDPYISFRYAKNLLDGHGWTFNPGVASGNAATAPGYVIALAALGGLGLTIPAAASVLFAAGLWSAAWFTARTYPHAGGTAAAFLVVLSPQLVNTRGMETALMLGLAAASIWACGERRDVLAAVLLVGLACVRPDGVLLAPAVVLWRWHRDGTVPWQLIRVGTVGGIAMGLVVLATVGVPSTLAAKVAQVDGGFGVPFGTPGTWLSLGVAPWWIVSGAGLLLNRRWRDQPAVWFGAAIAVVYGTLGVAAYAWYYAAPIYAVAVAAGAGLARRHLEPAIVAVLAAAMALSVSLPASRSGYRAAGQWLAMHSPADATVAATEVGIVGWESDRTLVSFLGLLDPARSDDLAQGDVSSWVEDYRPEYWVVNDAALALEGTARDRFGDRYDEVWRDGVIAVWARQDTS